jgi:electron transfer flavoprotein alpha/beta subunit
MKTSIIEEQPVPELNPSGGPTVNRMFQPEAAGRATMIEGDVEEIATRLVEILKETGVL